MARQHLVKALEDFQGLILAGAARDPSTVGFDRAQLIRIELVDALEALAGLLSVAREIEDQAGMKVLEKRVPIGPSQPIDGIDRRARFVGTEERPCRQQGGGEIGDWAA